MKKKTSNMCWMIMLVVMTAIFSPLHLHSQNNPPLTVQIYDSAATKGYIFTAPYLLTPPYVYHHPQMILDRFGNVVWYRVFLVAKLFTDKEKVIQESL